MTTNHWKILFLLVAIGFILRCIVVIIAPSPFPFPDSYDYHTIANNIISGKGFALSPELQVSRPPLYSLLLAALYSLGLSITGVKVLQALLGSLLAIVVYLFAYQISKNQQIAIFSAILYIFDPLQIAFSALILTELLFSCLLLLAMFSSYQMLQQDSKIWPIITGVLFALGTLCRSAFLAYIGFFSLFYLGYIFFSKSLNKSKIITIVWMGIAFILVMTPWSIRNWMVFQKFIPTTSKLGINLYEALGPGATGGPRMEKLELPEQAENLSEVERDKFLRRWILQYIMQNPWSAISLLPTKFGRFWNVSLNFQALRNHPANWSVILFSLLVYIFTLLGISQVERKHLLLLLLPVLYFLAIHMVFLGSVRYRVPIMIYLEIIAAYGAYFLYLRFSSRRSNVSKNMI